jgi:hypothetical protein
MKRRLLYYTLFIVILASCSGKKTETVTKNIDTIPMMVMQIQKCSRLYTAEYQIHKIITHDDTKKLSGSIMDKNFSINLPLGKRKIAIPMDATVKAYVDFSDFSKSNIHRNGQKIEIILPDPRIALTSTRIDHQEVKQHVALMRGNFSDEELSNYERQGRDAIIKSLPELGIVDMARASAARTLIPMMVQMGYKQEDITITFRKKFTIDDLQTLFDKTTIENGKAIK